MVVEKLPIFMQKKLQGSRLFKKRKPIAKEALPQTCSQIKVLLETKFLVATFKVDEVGYKPYNYYLTYNIFSTARGDSNIHWFRPGYCFL